jgi:hypothetical protein
MSQVYHLNARTNQHTRNIINKSKLTNIQLAKLYNLNVIPNANRSNIYRTLKAFNINNVPEEQKAKAKKFKGYEPAYLHINITYLPKFDKQNIIYL